MKCPKLVSGLLISMLSVGILAPAQAVSGSQPSATSNAPAPPAHDRFQKPSIDESIYDKWPSVGGGAISNDGRYVIYTISNGSFALHYQERPGVPYISNRTL